MIFVPYTFSDLILTASAALYGDEFRFSHQSLHLAELPYEELCVPGSPSVPVHERPPLIPMTYDHQRETVTVHVVFLLHDPSLQTNHPLVTKQEVKDLWLKQYSQIAVTLVARSLSVRMIACSNPSQVPPLVMRVGK